MKKSFDIITRNIETYKNRRLHLFLSQFSYEAMSKKKLLIYGLNAVGFDKKEKRILDIGFGNGLTLFSFNRSNEICGIEIAKNMVEFGNKTAEKMKYKVFEFKLYDGYGKIDFQHNYFDLIICSHVLEHVPDDRFLVDQIYRMMKYGGICAFLIPLDDDREERKLHARSYDIDSFNSLIDSLNLKVLFRLKGDKFSDYFRNYLELGENKFSAKVTWALMNAFCSKFPFSVQKSIESELLVGSQYTQYLIIGKK